ncbi:hypothetical protein [Falsibacillus pallidus]|uniref:YfjL-like protein n=1 Tax=Falsibacillus pallidus TaxID=493781 RepID=UPI003D979C4E
MNKKKTFHRILLFIFLAMILFIFNVFYGNPLSKYISKKDLEHYLHTHYPDKDFHLSKGDYVFPFGSYSYKVSEFQGGQESKSKEYEFMIGGAFSRKVRVDGIYEDNLDPNLMERLGKEAGEEINDLLTQHFSNINYVGARCAVLKDKLDENVKWDKSLDLDELLSINIFLDSRKQSKGEFYKEVTKIQTLLNEHGYNYKGVIVNGDLLDTKSDTIDWYVKYDIYFTKTQSIKLKDIN